MLMSSSERQLNTVEVVEHAKSGGIDSNNTIALWMIHTLKKMHAITATFATRSRMTSRKDDMEVPTSEDYTCYIDRNN